MNITKPDFDAIFTAEIATIGFQFEGLRLTNIVYLDNGIDKAPTSNYAEKLKIKLKNTWIQNRR